VEVKKGYSWSDQLGIAIATLTEAGQEELVNWTKDVCCTLLVLPFRISSQLAFFLGVDFDASYCPAAEDYRGDRH